MSFLSEIFTNAFVLIFGENALVLCKCLWDGFSFAFPPANDVIVQTLLDHMTTPYFIVGIIMLVASAYGIWFGKKGGKVLYAIVSLACVVVSLVDFLIDIKPI